MILLDTHALVWWINEPGQLSRLAKRHLNQAQTEHSVHVSAISFWEIALLTQKGRLNPKPNIERWAEEVARLSCMTIIPLDYQIAISSTLLPQFAYGDPADRIIAATALSLNCPLITKDQRLHAYPRLQCIW